MKSRIKKLSLGLTGLMMAGILTSCATIVKQSTFDQSSFEVGVTQKDKQFFNKDKLYTTIASTLSSIGWELAIDKSSKDLGLITTKPLRYGRVKNPVQYWELYLVISVKLLASPDENSFSVIVVPTKYLYNYRVGSLTTPDAFQQAYQAKLVRLTPSELKTFNANDNDREDLTANDIYSKTLFAIAQSLGQSVDDVRHTISVIEVSR